MAIRRAGFALLLLLGLYSAAHAADPLLAPAEIERRASRLGLGVGGHRIQYIDPGVMPGEGLRYRCEGRQGVGLLKEPQMTKKKTTTRRAGSVCGPICACGSSCTCGRS